MDIYIEVIFHPCNRIRYQLCKLDDAACNCSVNHLGYWICYLSYSIVVYSWEDNPWHLSFLRDCFLAQIGHFDQVRTSCFSWNALLSHWAACRMVDPLTVCGWASFIYKMSRFESNKIESEKWHTKLKVNLAHQVHNQLRYPLSYCLDYIMGLMKSKPDCFQYGGSVTKHAYSMLTSQGSVCVTHKMYNGMNPASLISS